MWFDRAINLKGGNLGKGRMEGPKILRLHARHANRERRVEKRLASWFFGLATISSRIARLMMNRGGEEGSGMIGGGGFLSSRLQNRPRLMDGID